jgi:hypothetical protein
MWLQHTMATLHASTRLRTRVVSYEQFLRSPAESLKPVLDLYPELEIPDSAWEGLKTTSKEALNHGMHSDAELDSLNPAIKLAYELCLKVAGGPKALDQGQFTKEINRQWTEFEFWWTLPPYEKTLSSTLRLIHNSAHGQQKWEAIYLLKRKPQTLELAFKAPRGTLIEGQLSDWPGQFLVTKTELVDAQGTVTPISLECATDVVWAPNELGVIWNIPRIGNHFRFVAPGGPCRFSITFSTNCEPSEVSRIASEYWLECESLRRKLGQR